MKKLSTLVLLATTVTAGAQSIVQSGFTFNPATLVVDAGQEITITLNSPHTAMEVSEDTWNANGATSNGGFDFGAGTHTFTLDEPGTYYYVCELHAGMGMKGSIVVNPGSGIADNRGSATPTLHLFPNPATDRVRITTAATGTTLTLTDVQGREVLRRTVNGADLLDLAPLAAGGYTVVLRDGSGAVVARDRLTIAR